MTASALFSGSTQPTPADINSRFSNLVAKGVYSGGLVTATGTNNNVTVSPYVAMTSFGMMVFDDAASTVGLSPAPIGTNQYVYIHATYSAFGPATVALLRTSTPQVDTATESYICVCVVKPYVTGFVVNDLIAYDLVSGTGRDQVTPVGDSKYLGYFQTLAERNAKYPNHVAGTVSVPRIGDTTSFGTTSTNYVVSFWDGLAWQDLENTAALKASFTSHVADTIAHTTADQHAALAGTYGIPSSANKYVTQDDPGILSQNLYESLQAAIGQTTLSQANPVVSKSLLIAVPRVFQVAVTATSSKILLTAAALGRTDFVAYLGKQGNNGQSSAVQYFAIEDDYGNGYISTVSGLPVYVTDVLDSTGTVQINPGDDASVDNHGFYNAEAHNGIVLQLSSSVAIGTRLYVRMNINGDISALTPNWPGSGGSSFLPAITAFRNGKNSYVSALLGDLNTLVIGTSTAGAIPNTQITTRLADVGVPPQVVQSFREGSTVRASMTVQTTASTGNPAGTVKWWTPSFRISYGANEDSPGVLIDSNGIQSYKGVFVTNASYTKLAGIDADGRVMAAQGNAIAPGFYFANELDADDTTPSTATGIYYRPTYAPEGSGDYGFDTHNGIGVSILGKTALYIARTNDTAPVSDMDCPLMILQDYEASANTMNYFIGMNNEIGASSDPTPGAISFGSWSSLSSFQPALVLDIKNSLASTQLNFQTTKQFLGKNSTLSLDEAHPAYSFANATGTGMFYVDAWANSDDTAQFNNGIGFSVNSHAAFVITQDIDSSAQTITGVIQNPLILNQRNDGVSISYDFAVSDASVDGSYSGSIRFGSIGYTGAYKPMLVVDSASSTVSVLVSARFSTTLTVNTNMQLSSTRLQFVDCGQGVSSTGSSIILGNQGGSYVEVLNSSSDISLYGNVTVHGTTSLGVFNVVGSSGNASSTGTLQTTVSGLLLGYGTSVNNTQKIFWGANNPSVNTPVAYLTTNGKVFAAAYNDDISYGFAGTAGVGVGIFDGSLKLFGNTSASNIDASGTLTAAQVRTGTLIVDTTVNAATVTAAGNIVANGAFVGPTITALEAAVSAAAPSVARLSSQSYSFNVEYFIPGSTTTPLSGQLFGPAATITYTETVGQSMFISENNVDPCVAFYDNSQYTLVSNQSLVALGQKSFVDSVALVTSDLVQTGKFCLKWSRSLANIFVRVDTAVSGTAVGMLSLILPESPALLPNADELIVRVVRSKGSNLLGTFSVNIHRPATSGVQKTLSISAGSGAIVGDGVLAIRARRSAGTYDWKIDTWNEAWKLP